jgi:hypothetical protein
MTGHRVAVWEVVVVHEGTKSRDRTARHFGWPRVLVKRALAYATPSRKRSARSVSERPKPHRLLADENASRRFVVVCRQLA